MESHPTQTRQPNSAIAATFGRLFRRARQVQGWSQQQVAGRAVRVARSTISDLERGRSLPAFDALVELADVLHLDLHKLVDNVRQHEQSSAGSGTSLQDPIVRACRCEREGSHDEARRLYRLVRTTTPRIACGVALRLAVVQARLGCTLQARRDALRATASVESEPAWATRAYLLAAILMHEARLFDAAELHASRAAALAGERDHAALAASHWQSARSLRMLGRPQRARAALLIARPMARAARDARLALAIDGELVDCLASLQQNEAVFELLQRGLVLACKQGTTDDELGWRLRRIERLRHDDRERVGRELRELPALARCCRGDRLRYRAELWLHRSRPRGSQDRSRRIRRLLALRARARADRTMTLPACFDPSDPGCPSLTQIETARTAST